MELEIKDDELFYSVEKKRFLVAKIFKDSSRKWSVVNPYDDFRNDFFTDDSFRTKRQAIEYVKETMTGIFREILNNENP